MKPTLAAFNWYRREEYPELLRICEDRDSLPITFEEWLRRSEEEIDNLRKRGVRAYKVEIRPNEIIAYCQREGIKRIDEKARSALATLIFWQHVQAGDIKIGD